MDILRGAEAAGNAVETKKNAILFNPAAINLEAYKLDSSDYHANMTAYIVEGEILHEAEKYVSEPIGKTVYLPTQYPIIHINTHSPADVVIDSINTNNAVQNHSMVAVKNSIDQYDSNEKVVISKTIDNKAKEISKDVNEAFKNPKVQQFLR